MFNGINLTLNLKSNVGVKSLDFAILWASFYNFTKILSL